MKRSMLLSFLIMLSMLGIGQTVNIGDILCTDGSIVSCAAFPTSGKTAQGIVFYVDDTDSHGWAVALNNQSSSIKWCSEGFYGYDVPNLPNSANARAVMHDLDGYGNTGAIRSQGNSSQFPAAWAVDYDNGWYLPSGGQLRYLYSYMPEINASLQVVGGTLFPINENHYWWSSSEFSEYHAYDMNTGGSIGDYVKDNHSNYPPNGIAVRQIRDFTVANPIHPSYHVGDLITNDDGSQGILFYVTPDQSDGWMVALNDASTSVPWGNGDIPGLDNQTCSSPYGSLLNETDGFANTTTIRNNQAGMNTAANVVDFEHGWYLPTAGQLSKLFGALPFIEDQLQAHGSTLANAEYWSSTEADGNNAFTLSCSPSANVRAGHFARRDKASNYRVREVRNLSFVTPPLPDPTFPDNVIQSDCNRPLEGNPWDIQLLHSSSDQDVASYSPILVGDIDGNGVSDIVVAKYNGNNYRSREINVYSGRNLSLQHSFTVPDTIYLSNGPYAIGRYTKADGTMEGAIFTHCYDKKIRAYSINGTLLNVSDRATSCDGMVSLADFNGDGFPEVYAGSDIFDAATLKWLCSGPANGNKGLGYRGTPAYSNGTYHHTYYAMSVAYNALGDEKQELICGNTIYTVNIVSRTNANLNSVTVAKTITPPSGCSQDGHVCLADFDLDGETEVLVIRDDTNDQIVDNTYFYAYKPSNGQILFQKALRCASTSYVFIGNTDTEPYPEIIFLENQPNGYSESIFCWRYMPQSGLATVWSQYHDDRSGQTAMTLFDFNQDNIMELVYRDNNNLRIINASGKSHVTGNDTIRPYNIYTRRMAAGTGCEYPIVADVNGDGVAEIVATGLIDQYVGYDVGYGGIHVFGSPSSWSSARPVWNQYMYHVTNVNEDLSIPTFCFNKATVFTAPDGTIRRPYNNFLQQAYYINQYGEPYNPGGYSEIEVSGAACSTFTFHGVTYNESGNYEQLVESPDGCDTLYHIAVSIGGTITHEWSQQACNHFVWNGTNYTEPGDYIQDFVSVEGCDSIVTLHLAFSDALEYDVDTAVCQSLWWNGQEYTEAGVYTQQFLDVDGCDSIVHLHLSFAGQPEGIPEIIGLTEVNVGTDLILGQYYYHIDSVPLATHYEWTLEGADWIMDTTGTHCSLLITTPGTAILKVRAWNDCGETEQEIVIHGGFFDVDEHQSIHVSLYPNPANDKVLVEAEGIKSVKVYNMQGQLLKTWDGEASQRVAISLHNIVAGMYAVEVLTERGSIVSKMTVTHKE